MNLTTFMITITCVTALGVVTVVYGVIPAVGTAVAAGLIYQAYKLLRPTPVFKTEFMPAIDFNY